jgi:hypothetical protein
MNWTTSRSDADVARNCGWIARRRQRCAVITLLLCGGAVLFMPTCKNEESTVTMREQIDDVPGLDLSAFPDAPPKRPLQLLFIHHSCGGQLLAEPGTEDGTDCIYRTALNGGGLRAALERCSYTVHEASYGSRIGQNTDIFDWLPKFRDAMAEVLTCDTQNVRYADGRRNDIVVFKSCFPNNDFVAEGSSPGDPMGPNLTVWNAKAAYAALLGELQKYQQVLFVCVTAPPLAPKADSPRLWKRLLDKVRGRETSLAARGRLAREFNNWLTRRDGWLDGGKLTNVVVFDYYDILTGHGVSNLSVFPTGGGWDSHPSREGNQKASEVFVPFLNRAVRRAGLSE